MKQSSNHKIKAAFDQVDSSTYDHEALWQSIEPVLPSNERKNRLLLWIVSVVILALASAMAVALLDDVTKDTANSDHASTNALDHTSAVVRNEIDNIISATSKDEAVDAHSVDPSSEMVLDRSIARKVVAKSSADQSPNAPRSTYVLGSQHDVIGQGTQQVDMTTDGQSLLQSTDDDEVAQEKDISDIATTVVVSPLATSLTALPLADRLIQPQDLFVLPTKTSGLGIDRSAGLEFSFSYGLLDVNLSQTGVENNNDLTVRNMQENPLDLLSTELRYFRQVLRNTEVFVGLQYSQQTINRQAQDISTDTTIADVLIQRIISPTGTTEIYDERPIISTTVIDANSYNRYCAIAIPIGLRQYFNSGNRAQFFIEGELSTALATWQSGMIYSASQVYDLSTDVDNIFNNSLQMNARLSAGVSVLIAGRSSLLLSAGYWRQLTETYNTDNYNVSGMPQSMNIRLGYRFNL